MVTEGVTAATSAMDRCIPAAEGPTGDGTSRGEVRSGNGGGDIHEGAAGPPGGAVVFARTATAAAVPCDTGGHEIEIDSTAIGSIKNV